MTKKPTYKELRQRIKELEKEAVEHKRAKEELQTILNAVPVIIFQKDRDGKTIRTNQAFDTMIGLSKEEILGKTTDELFPEHGKDMMKDDQEVMESGKPKLDIIEHYDSPEGTRWSRTGKAPLKDKKGTVVGLIGYTADITEQKQAEEALRESEEKYRNIFEQSRDAIYITSPRGEPVAFNQATLDLFGLTLEELSRVKAENLYVDPSERARNNALLEKNGFIKDCEIRLKLSDGREIICLDTSAVWRDEDGKIKGYIGTLRDITELRRAEKALRSSEDKFSKAFHHSPLLLTISDIEDGTYLDINDKFSEVSGFSREEAIGKTSIDLHWISQEDRKRLKEALETQGHVSGMELTLLKKDKQEIHCLYYGELITVDDRQRLLSIAQDITKSKLAEQEKEKLEDQLQRAQKMEAIGTLAGGVAHDLNNVLSGIVSYPDLLLMDLPEDSPLRKPILTMQSSGQKAVAIVQDLLAMARRGVVITDVVNLNDIISEYLKSLEYEKLISFHPGVEVKTKLEADLLNLSGSSVHLSKIVMNLVSNATEAMSHGGKIFISTENRHIDRPISGYDIIREGDYNLLTVSDTGAGISPKDMKRIFEPFYTKKVMGRSGTGLGMAVVWGTVKDHKGYIDIQSTEGKGTTFTLYFPATREKIAKEKAQLSIEDYMGKGESILVVDDVKEQRELALTLLTTLGYAADTVSSGEEAVEYLKEHTVDLIVLDMIMDPGIDGLDTYKQIHELHPRQKAIIASGFSETDRVKEAQRLRAGKYIRKPYTLEKIGLTVKEELEK